MYIYMTVIHILHFYPWFLGYIVELGIDYESVRLQHPREAFLKQFTFNSTRKSMTTVIPLPNNGGARVLTKGASEIVISKCTRVMMSDGQVHKYM